MADAVIVRFDKKRVETPQPPIVTYVDVPSRVQLDLSMEEAETLRMVARRIGGHPKWTRRGHIAHMDDALKNAGVPDVTLRDVFSSGAIHYHANAVLAQQENDRLKSLIHS